jgi:hypothetical protein
MMLHWRRKAIRFKPRAAEKRRLRTRIHLKVARQVERSSKSTHDKCSEAACLDAIMKQGVMSRGKTVIREE